jgi:hypothetical protein
MCPAPFLIYLLKKLRKLMKQLKSKGLSIMLIAAATLLSCHHKAELSNTQEIADYSQVAKEPESQSGMQPEPAPANRKIIWRGNLELQVKDVDKTTTAINEIATKYGAFVAGMDLTRTNYNISNQITVRVNSASFFDLIDEIKEKAMYVRKVSISSNDVTEEYLDIESRLQTKKKVRDRYIDLLQNRTGKVSDIIEAEEAIRKITEEIEAQEGRLRYLNDRIKLSTVNLLIFQKVEYQAEPTVFKKSFLDKAQDALSNGWSIFVNLVLALLNIWPLIVLAFVVVWQRKRIRRFWNRNKKQGL